MSYCPELLPTCRKRAGDGWDGLIPGGIKTDLAGPLFEERQHFEDRTTCTRWVKGALEDHAATIRMLAPLADLEVKPMTRADFEAMRAALIRRADSLSWSELCAWADYLSDVGLYALPDPDGVSLDAYWNRCIDEHKRARWRRRS